MDVSYYLYYKNKVLLEDKESGLLNHIESHACKLKVSIASTGISRTGEMLFYINDSFVLTKNKMG